MKITKGTWKEGKTILAQDANRARKSIIAGTVVTNIVANTYGDSLDELEANAELIAEAGTVANETGLSPRQILEQRNELLRALQGLLQIHQDKTFGDNVWRLMIEENAVKAISKCTPSE